MATRKKILVVDDDEAVTTYLQAKMGTTYDVVTTNVSTRALALAKSEHPDLVICDIDMPQLDGGDLAKKLASDPAKGSMKPLMAVAVGRFFSFGGIWPVFVRSYTLTHCAKFAGSAGSNFSDVRSRPASLSTSLWQVEQC